VISLELTKKKDQGVFDRYNLNSVELAQKLGYHPQYVRYLASMGRLPAIKRGRMWMFCEDEVFEFFRSKTTPLVKGSKTHDAGRDSSEGSDLLR